MRELKLPNLGPLRLSIKDAGSGMTAGLHDTWVQTNDVTGATYRATVAPIH